MAKQGKTDHNAYSAFAPDARVTDYEAVFGWTDNDRALLERLQDFIPDKVFDAHAHLLDLSKDDIYQIFYRTGCQLYGLEELPGEIAF